MVPLWNRCVWQRFWLTTLLAGLVLSLPAPAAEPSSPTGSLQSVPADAAFYTSLLRNREQIEAIANSRAWARLKGLPAVQMGLQTLQAQLKQPNPQLATGLQLYQMPENQQLIALLGDMFSEEVFCYGGESFVSFADLIAQLIGGMRFGPALLHVTGQAQGATPAQLQIVSLLHILADHPELVKVPDLLVGFKLSKTGPAEAQLKRLEQLLNNLVEQAPLLKGHFKREKLTGGDFLVLTLDGTMVPWQRLPVKDFEQKPDEFEPLLKKLAQLKLTVSLGIRGNNLFFVLGESNIALRALGAGKRLVDRPEFKSFAAHADKRLTSVSYSSQAMRAKLAMTKEDLNGLVEMAGLFLDQAGLPDEQRDRLRKDLPELAKDLKAFIPDIGATLTFSFLTGRGTESYAYDWSQQLRADGTKPLSLLNHVGGSPLLAVVGRSRYAPENYQMLVKWIKVGYRYFEEIGLPKLEGEQKEKFEQITKAFLPFVQRLDKVTGQMLLPALADGQQAFVLDAKLKSRQWIQQLPPTVKEMPMLEPALVLGVSDAALLRKAVGEYRLILNDVIARVHELAPQVPDFPIPDPETRKMKSGTLYFYPVPEALGVDRQLAPAAGLSDHVAVLALSTKHAERLLARTPLAANTLFSGAQKPLVSAVHFDFAGMIDTLTPWIEVGVQVAQSRIKADPDDEATKAPHWVNMLGQIPPALQILKVFRSYSSITYFEGNALVTHSETIIHDL